MEKVLLKDIGMPSYKVENYLQKEGYKALEKVLKMSQKEVIEEIKNSSLVGRGGAAFPTGKKWEVVYADKNLPRYVIANADESEPGVFKDRVLLEKNPHQVIEGLIIAGYAVGANEGFIFIRGEYTWVFEILKKALEEARERNFLGDNILGSNFSFDIKIYQGAGSYMSGEETALLESMEGKPAWARGKPPYPANFGFLGKPTLVNNVETLANVVPIVLKGSQWYRSIGVEGARGVKLFALSGDVKKPGVYELPLGVTLRELIEEYGGGMIGEFKCALPGGISSRFVTNLDVHMDYMSLRKEGSMLGAAGVIVLNKERDIVKVCLNIVKFFFEESCGFCVPCRLGTKKAVEILQDVVEGKIKKHALENLKELEKVMFLASNCGLGQFALCATASAIDKFKEEFRKEERKEKEGCDDEEK